VVAIVDERFVHAHAHTDIHSSDFVSVHCHEFHWTDNNNVDDNDDCGIVMIMMTMMICTFLSKHKIVTSEHRWQHMW